MIMRIDDRLVLTDQQILALSPRGVNLYYRMSRGELDTKVVRLAAYVGDGDAAAILRDPFPKVPEHLRAWMQGLDHWGRTACIRAGHAALVHADRVLAAARVFPHCFEEPISQMITAVGCWLPFSDSPQAGGLLERYRSKFESSIMFPLPEPCDENAAFHMVQAVLFLFGAIATSDVDSGLDPAACAEFAAAVVDSAQKAIEGKPVAPDFPTLEAAIRHQMMEWVNGLICVAKP